MKITDHIKKAKGKTQFTFEILPPVKGHSINTIFENIDPLMEFNPPFIDVTYHREEYVYNDLGNGFYKKK
jgi:methylenetetrahydrofolate reductase (NADPH)